MRTSRFVEGFGTYQFDTDLYEVAMTSTVAQLRESVHRGCEGMESGTRTRVNKLRKADLAAMVAEWETGARDNQRYVDEKFAAEIDALVARDLAADPIPPNLVERVQAKIEPVTETDVEVAKVDVVVQLKGRLYDGKLIAVVNRWTKFANPILATVEVGGHRFLVNANDMLAA